LGQRRYLHRSQAAAGRFPLRCRTKRLMPQALGALSAVLFLLFATANATAEAAGNSDLAIERAWARASIGTSRPAAAYFTVVNNGDEADRLTGISSPVAAMAEVHAVTEESGVMRMHPAGPVDLPPNSRLVLEPGGLHVMLMQLREPLVKDGSVTLELQFERAGTMTVEAPVFGPGSMGPDQ